MKIRIGISPGGAGLDAQGLVTLGTEVVLGGFDSLWLPEVLTAPGVDPLVGLAWAGAATPDLKLGTTMLLPGRNLVRLAGQVAALDALSEGRFLVTFVPGLARGPERSAVGPPPERRGALMEEALGVLRRLWRGETVSHDGPAGTFSDVSIAPLPRQDPFEVWLGGIARPSLERCGRCADGWLPAMCTPEEAAAGRRVVEESAVAADRHISAEHFGVSIGYTWAPLHDRVTEALRARARGRPLEALVPASAAALRELVSSYIDVGFSKFVLRPLLAPRSWGEELASLSAAVGDLQT